MLAVFGKSVVEAPEQLVEASTDKAMSSNDLLQSFKNIYKEPVTFQFDKSFISYTHEQQALLKPRSFAVLDDMFCVFEGILENLAPLRQEYGLSKMVNEVMVIIEGYRHLRDRKPDHMLREWRGHFSFVLFDKTSSKVFVGADSDGKVQLYWGVTSDGSLAFSDNLDLLKQGCDESCSPFPSGCFFSNECGLRSYDRPLNPVAASPKGSNMKDNVFGVTFEVQDMDQQQQQPPSGPWAF